MVAGEGAGGRSRERSGEGRGEGRRGAREDNGWEGGNKKENGLTIQTFPKKDFLDFQSGNEPARSAQAAPRHS